MRKLAASSLVIVLGLCAVAAEGCTVGEYEPPPPQGTGGQGGTGGACGSGDTTECYDGPAETKGVGECKAGQRICAPDAFPMCEGQVLPKLEDCKQEVDTDCDTIKGCHGEPLDAAQGAADMKDDLFYSVAVGANGVAYMVGVQAADVSAQLGPTKGRVLFTRRAPDGDVTDWSTKLALSVGDLAYATDVAVAPNGDVAVVGLFAGTLVVGDASYASESGSADAFLAVFDTNGDARYLKQFGDGTAQAATTVAYDSAGALYIGGAFTGSITFGSTPFLAEGETDGFVAAFTADGTYRWAKVVTGAGQQVIEQVTLNKNGQVFVAGRMSGGATIGGTTLPGTETRDAFLGRLASENGNVVWTRVIGGSGDQAIGGLAVSPAGEVAVSGTFHKGSIDLGGPTYTNDELETSDMFLAFYSDEEGKFIRSMPAQSMGSQAGTGIAYDPVGDLLVACVFTRSMNIGNHSFAGGTNDLDTDACVFKVKGQSLEVLWAHDYGDLWPQVAAAVAASPLDGHPLLVGGFWVKLEGANPELTSKGVNDPFVLELSP